MTNSEIESVVQQALEELNLEWKVSISPVPDTGWEWWLDFNPGPSRIAFREKLGATSLEMIEEVKRQIHEWQTGPPSEQSRPVAGEGKGASPSRGAKAGEKFVEIIISDCRRGNTRFLSSDTYQWVSSFYFTPTPFPSEEWIQIFAHVRQARYRRTSLHRYPITRVDLRGIIIMCHPDELQDHYNDLKADVVATNQQYQAALNNKTQSEEAKHLDSAIDEAIAKLKL